MSADVDRIRYPAFLSYCHRDMAFARRLHRRLEGYALPRRLVGRPGPRGPVPARLAPIFRDREELSAAGDLSAEVRAALAASGSLIVVCSPGAKASPWVAREIETFRALHPDRPVLAVLAEGEPGEAFPPPLLTGGTEPLAADFRKGRDGEALGFLKLVSGVAGVGLDELIQRDAQRRLRAVMAVTAGAVAVMLAMGGLAVFAFQARAEAERRRADAEGLVEFMLTDLRSKLKGVGRLDVMRTVNERALAHYASQDLRDLKPGELQQRAAVLVAMGSDDIDSGRLDLAARQFSEAERTTQALLQQAPDDPERVFGYAQAVFWLAEVERRRGHAEKARRGFEAYRDFALRMLRLSPRAAKYRRELAFAEGDLCVMALARPPDPKAALRHCSLSLSAMEMVAKQPDSEVGVQADLVNRYAWMSDAYWANGDRLRCRRLRLQQEAALHLLIENDPGNLELKDSWLSLQRSLAWFERESGDPQAARKRLLAAKKMSDQLVAFDPENQSWISKRQKIIEDIVKIEAISQFKGGK
jgi:hypothetical protein